MLKRCGCDYGACFCGPSYETRERRIRILYDAEEGRIFLNFKKEYWTENPLGSDVLERNFSYGHQNELFVESKEFVTIGTFVEEYQHRIP